MDNSKRNQLVSAVLAGVLSTTAMTFVMQGLYKRLPHQQKYPLPPEEITMVAEVTFFGRQLHNPKTCWLNADWSLWIWDKPIHHL